MTRSLRIAAVVWALGQGPAFSQTTYAVIQADGSAVLVSEQERARLNGLPDIGRDTCRQYVDGGVRPENDRRLAWVQGYIQGKVQVVGASPSQASSIADAVQVHSVLLHYCRANLDASLRNAAPMIEQEFWESVRRHTQAIMPPPMIVPRR